MFSLTQLFIVGLALDLVWGRLAGKRDHRPPSRMIERSTAAVGVNVPIRAPDLCKHCGHRFAASA